MDRNRETWIDAGNEIDLDPDVDEIIHDGYNMLARLVAWTPKFYDLVRV
jgi:hypothetical protein